MSSILSPQSGSTAKASASRRSHGPLSIFLAPGTPLAALSNCISDAKLATTPIRQNHHFALQVADISAAKAALERKGVKIVMGPVERPDGVTQIFLADPDGYIVELSNT